MRWTRLIALVAVLAACQTPETTSPQTAPSAATASTAAEPPSPPLPAAVPSTTARPAPSLSFPTRTTVELAFPPAVALLVDTLAAHRRIESSAVGIAASPSDVYADFKSLAAATTPDQAAALLAHESPTVRGYMAGHVLDTQPHEAARIYPLLTDETTINTLQGCIGGMDTVATDVADTLGHRLRVGGPALTALVLRGAKDTSLRAGVRARLLGHAARARVPEAKGLALALLGDSDPEIITGALQALELLESDDVLSAVTPMVSHPDSRVRSAVALVLGNIEGATSDALLRQLELDPDKTVQRGAERAIQRRRR